MGSKFDFRLTQRADTDLDEIVAYISMELSNPQAASAFMDSLEKAIEELCLFPESGVPVDNEFLSEISLRKKRVKNYNVYYWPDFTEKRVYVLRILYESRDMDAILRNLEL